MSPNRCTCFALGLALALPAAAQPLPPGPAPAADVETARRYFEAGVASMARGNFAEAVNALESSARLRRTASVALNLGLSLHRLGRLVEARSRLQEFVETASPAQHAQHDAEVGRTLAEIGRRVGRVEVAALVPANAAVTVDGRAVVLDAANQSVVDPGDHVVRAVAAGFTAFERPVHVAEGGVASVRVVLVDGRADVTPAPVAGRSVLTRWWFWTAAAVVVAGATAGIVLATSSPDPDPVPGGTTGRVLQGISGAGVSW